MTRYEDLINRLIQRSKFTRIEIEKLVEQKKEKIGSGYLTNEGALFLIASDMGISLNADVQIKRPMEGIIVEPVSLNDLQTKAKMLRTDRLKRKIISNFIAGAMMLGLFGFTGIVGHIENKGNIPLELSIFVLILAIILAAIWLKFPARYLSKNEKTFLEFFSAYEKLKEFKYRESMDVKKYQNALNNLAYYISSWTRSTAPNDISELPDTISSKLKGKIIPLYQEKDSEQIEYFIQILEKLVMVCYVGEIAAATLRSFADDLSLFEIKETKKLEKERQTNLVYKLMIIPPITGIILFFTFNSVDPAQVHASLGYSLTISVAILIAIVTLVKRK